MSTYIDADCFARWEKGEFDLLLWIEEHAADTPVAFPATAWQQLYFCAFAWQPARAAKRMRSIQILAGLPVAPFMGNHAVRAAKLAAELKAQTIGFADFQIAATA